METTSSSRRGESSFHFQCPEGGSIRLKYMMLTLILTTWWQSIRIPRTHRRHSSTSHPGTSARLFLPRAPPQFSSPANGWAEPMTGILSRPHWTSMSSFGNLAVPSALSRTLRDMISDVELRRMSGDCLLTRRRQRQPSTKNN